MARPSDGSTGDDLVRSRLRARGVAEHVIQGGEEGLIARWREFVEAVDRGYNLGLADYRNDLDIRSLISVAGLSARVAGEDARLRSLLIPARREIWSSDVSDDDAFWLRGYPRNATGELREDLEAEGLLTA